MYSSMFTIYIYTTKNFCKCTESRPVLHGLHGNSLLMMAEIDRGGQIGIQLLH